MTAERINPTENSENPIFQRHVAAYKKAQEFVSGNLLEIGCGEGYGIEYLKNHVDSYTAIDKFQDSIDRLKKKYSEIKFHQLEVPELSIFEENTFDTIISFQVIEHIKNDKKYLEEIKRVLKPSGKFICTTPNIEMSLTRNPWHVREYTTSEISNLFSLFFERINLLGVYGNQKFSEYYEANKKSVAKFKKLDILNLEKHLPRQILQIPYDILNRLNRKKLAKQNTENVLNIISDDFYFDKANSKCYDFFLIAEK
jgi:ubiquinone/menaquinone biosynthesis C-methylase UbiE